MEPLRDALKAALGFGGEDDAAGDLERAVENIVATGQVDMVSLRTLKRVCRQLHSARKLLEAEDG